MPAKLWDFQGCTSSTSKDNRDVYAYEKLGGGSEWEEFPATVWPKHTRFVGGHDAINIIML